MKRILCTVKAKIEIIYLSGEIYVTKYFRTAEANNDLIKMFWFQLWLDQKKLYV